MVVKSILKTLLTPAEKYLIKNQKQFALDSASSSSDTESEIDTQASTLYYQPYAWKLAQGVKMRKKSLMSSYGGSHKPRRKASAQEDPFDEPDSGLQANSKDDMKEVERKRKLGV